MVAASGPNAEQITYWNEVSGPKWVALADVLHAQIGHLGTAAMDALGLEPGQRVLDVGCGCGQTALELATRVGAGGSVVGLDISAPMLAEARRRAGEGGAENVAFVHADAQTHTLEPQAFDRVFSRFGVMFFEDPAQAFHNLLGAVAPAGRLAFVCWQALGANPWMTVPLGAVAEHVPLPPPPEPGAPGPMAFAEPGRVERILGEAGWDEVAIEPLEGELIVGRGMALAQAVEFMMQVGPASRLLQDADPELREAAAASVREALAPFETPEGLRMASAAWIVRAHRP